MKKIENSDSPKEGSQKSILDSQEKYDATELSPKENSIKERDSGSTSELAFLELVVKDVSEAYKRIDQINTEMTDIEARITSIKEKIKPVSRIDRQKGVRPTIKADDRKMLRIEVRALKAKKDLLRAEKDGLTEAFNKASIKAIATIAKNSISSKALSKSYILKNKRFIISKIIAMLQNSIVQRYEEIQFFKRLSNDMSEEGRQEFKKQFGKFLNEFDEEVYIFCSTQNDFKSEIFPVIQFTLKNWNGKKSSTIEELNYPEEK